MKMYKLVHANLKAVKYFTKSRVETGIFGRFADRRQPQIGISKRYIYA